MCGDASFQLTPSRRATLATVIFANNGRYFNSRPHGGRHFFSRIALVSIPFQLTPSRRATLSHNAEIMRMSISTHALTEGDNAWRRKHARDLAFQLTPSRRATSRLLTIIAIAAFQLTSSRRATNALRLVRQFLCISTHALTEGDVTIRCLRLSASYFNSRPHGGRRTAIFHPFSDTEISTHALTEGDQSSCVRTRSHRISTHALTEGDFVPYLRFIKSFHFNSRPHGGDLLRQLILHQSITFQLTPSRRATCLLHPGRGLDKIFQLTPSRRATSKNSFPEASGEFQLTPSRRATRFD